MRKLFLMISMFALFNTPCFSADLPEHYVAMVGDVPITTHELNRHRDKIMPFNVNFHGGVTEEKKKDVLEKALQELIIQTYKVCYANNLGLQAPQEKVDNIIKKLNEKFKTKEELDAALGTETFDEVISSYKKTLLAKKAEESAIESKINVSENSVKEYYEQNKERFFYPKQFRASHLLIKVDPAATEEVRAERYKKAEMLMQQAKTGEDFYNLAYYNSEDRTSFVGGDMGMFHAGQAAKSIEEALQKMKVDEISDVVETLVGYHVLKLTQVNEPRQLSFDEMKGKIREALEKEQRDTLYEEWITNLKATYKVTRLDNETEPAALPK